ncbi:hypothetical protein NQZ68_017041 [Dissostichus eleginoides]|nr:hypothetical protein NQZ68_017041 [Dissostichus eleginoides]
MFSRITVPVLNTSRLVPSLSVGGSGIHHGPERSFLSDSSISALHLSREERTAAVTWNMEQSVFLQAPSEDVMTYDDRRYKVLMLSNTAISEKNIPSTQIRYIVTPRRFDPSFRGLEPLRTHRENMPGQR